VHDQSENEREITQTPFSSKVNELIMHQTNAPQSTQGNVTECPSPGSPHVGFRHQRNRNQRLSAQHKIKPSAPPMSPVIPLSNRYDALAEENSQSQPQRAFHIQAAKASTTSSIFVSKLSPETTEKEIRDHIIDIGVKHRELDDVSYVKTNNCNDWASFRITVSTKEAKDLVFNAKSWPPGVVRRPFMTRNNNNNRRVGYVKKSVNGYHPKNTNNRRYGNDRQQQQRGWDERVHY